MYNGLVRTTIELKPEHRARLLELAARRGQKGFSSVVAEAIDAYLEASTENDHLRNKALQLRGSLTPEEAEQFRREVAQVRDFWR
jgi:predicted DNA-binding protein